MDFQRDFIAVLDGHKLSDAASKVRRYMWENDPLDAPDGTTSPGRVSVEDDRDSIDLPKSPPAVYEEEFRRMEKTSRANTFGPQARHLASLTRPAKEDRTVSAPEVERSEVIKNEDPKIPRSARPTGNTQRAITLPGTDMPYQVDSEHHEPSGLIETLHGLKERIWGVRPKVNSGEP
jgi:hypothetical protein